jgi:hypothetical protein
LSTDLFLNCVFPLAFVRALFYRLSSPWLAPSLISWPWSFIDTVCLLGIKPRLLPSVSERIYQGNRIPSDIGIGINAPK